MTPCDLQSVSESFRNRKEACTPLLVLYFSMLEKALNVGFFAKWDWGTVISASSTGWWLMTMIFFPVFLATHLEKNAVQINLLWFCWFLLRYFFLLVTFSWEKKKKKLSIISTSKRLAKSPADISAAGRCNCVLEETEEKPKGLARKLIEKLKKW